MTVFASRCLFKHHQPSPSNAHLLWPSGRIHSWSRHSAQGMLDFTVGSDVGVSFGWGGLKPGNQPFWVSPDPCTLADLGVVVKNRVTPKWVALENGNTWWFYFDPYPPGLRHLSIGRSASNYPDLQSRVSLFLSCVSHFSLLNLIGGGGIVLIGSGMPWTPFGPGSKESGGNHGQIRSCQIDLCTSRVPAL